MMDHGFCSRCGFLIQDSQKTMCNGCLNTENELKLVCYSCLCEYCTGISFHLLNDPPDWNDTDEEVILPRQSLLVADAETRERWRQEQEMLKQRLSLEDNREIRKLRHAIEKQIFHSNKEFYIGGMDISFIKGDEVNACAALVVVSFPDLQLVYEDYKMIRLTAPYIPGFLAFREACFLVDLYEKLVADKPQFKPTVIFLDGNGVLHPREFGIASHVGVLLSTPCLGVAKHLIHIDNMVNAEQFKTSKSILKKAGDTVPLKNCDNKTVGMALRSLDSTTNPIYVSCGHMMTLETAVILVQACCKYRIPEPVRQADLNSREYLRQAEQTW